MQIHPVPIFKLNQPAIACVKIRGQPIPAIYFVWALHIQSFSKTIDPAFVFVKRLILSHDIDDIVVLKNILGRVRICPRAVHVDGTNALVLFCCAEDQIKHFLLCAQTITPFWVA